MIPPRESMGKGRQNYIDTIPDEFQDAICKCKPDNGQYAHLVKKLTNTGVVGITVHVKCGKPTNLWTYLEECANCYDFYLIRDYPDQNLLCEGCA